MRFTDEEITELSEKVSLLMSEKRFKHTLGVLESAERIGSFFDGVDISELRAAALLHDVAKELDLKDQLAFLEANGEEITEDDLNSPLIIHSLSAPLLICRDFPLYSTDSLLSAVYNHTTGAENMTLFDKIIFLSDYVEAGRTYENCISVREMLFTQLSKEKSREELEEIVDRCVLCTLEFTIANILARGKHLNLRTVRARNYYLSLVNNKI